MRLVAARQPAGTGEVEAGVGSARGSQGREAPRRKQSGPPTRPRRLRGRGTEIRGYPIFPSRPSGTQAALADETGMKFMETSALDATNVEEAFTQLLNDIYANLPAREEKSMVLSPVGLGGITSTERQFEVDLQPAIPRNFHYENHKSHGWCPKPFSCSS